MKAGKLQDDRAGNIVFQQHVEHGFANVSKYGMGDIGCCKHLRKDGADGSLAHGGGDADDVPLGVQGAMQGAEEPCLGKRMSTRGAMGRKRRKIKADTGRAHEGRGLRDAFEIAVAADDLDTFRSRQLRIAVAQHDVDSHLAQETQARHAFYACAYDLR